VEPRSPPSTGSADNLDARSAPYNRRPECRAAVNLQVLFHLPRPDVKRSHCSTKRPRRCPGFPSRCAWRGDCIVCDRSCRRPQLAGEGKALKRPLHKATELC
jgi:hypothetical protein